MVRNTGFVLVVVSIVTVMIAGCASRGMVLAINPHAAHETLVQSAEDHRQQVLDIVAHDRRALVEDLDLLFLTDRPTRLTRWHDQ